MNKQAQPGKRTPLAAAEARKGRKAGAGYGESYEVTEAASDLPDEVTVDGGNADSYTPAKGNAARDANSETPVAGLTVDISFILHILSSFSGTFIP